MTAVVLLPDGVGVRNFLLGDFLKQLSEREQLYVLHVIQDELLSAYKGSLNGNVQWGELGSYKETPISMTLRYALAYAQMHWADTRAMRHNLRQPVKGSWKTRSVHKAAHLVGRVAARPSGINALDNWHCREVSRSAEVSRYHQLFERLRPSVLFCSHQRPPAILPPVLAAKSLGIPTATFIFSWDNLTSKGRIAAPFDHFLVWSQHMRQELLKYYPDVAPERVHIVGTPQFDPYADRNLLWSREEFFSRINADPERPLICYSGGDTGTCPEDPLHVDILMRLVRASRIKGNPNVLLRSAPVDDGSRYEKVRRDYPELIYAQPQWIHTTPGDWSRVLPLQDDVQFLANLTHYADLNINLASTMTLDFAIRDKPVVNIAFDVASPPVFKVPLLDFYYKFEHYAPVVDFGAARLARTPEELAEHINTYLQQSSLDRAGRQKFVDLELGAPVGQASQNIIQVLEEIAR